MDTVTPQKKTKEEEFESLVEFRKNMSVYFAARDMLLQEVEKQNTEIDRANSKIFTLTNPESYYNKPISRMDEWYSYGIFQFPGIFCAIATFVFSLFAFGIDSFKDFLIKLVVSIIVGLGTNILIKIFFSRKAKVNRKFKNEEPTRKTSIAQMKKIIEISEGKIEALESEIEELDEKFYQIPAIIHKSDYQYIDYVIYLYQTGRADDLKEALKQVDLERRNSQLVETMEKMSSTISRAVHNACSMTTSAISQMETRMGAALQETNNQLRLANVQIDTSSRKIQSLLEEGNKISSMELENIENLSRRTF